MAGRIATAFIFSILSWVPGFSPGALAYETDELPGYFPEAEIEVAPESPPPPPPSPLALRARLRKFHLALKALGIPEESTPGFFGFPEPAEVLASEVSSRFPYYDPDGGLQRYLSLDSRHVSLHRDLPPALSWFHSSIDFSYPFSAAGPSFDSAALMERLQKVARQVAQPWSAKPLAGLRVVLDPGHMGTPEWDQVTGKFVRHQGRKVSEGEIALWTAYLVATDLEKLGAEVHLTRDEPGTVAATAPFSFDPTPHIAQYFYNSIDSWMAPWFGLSDSEFVARVKSAPETKRAFSESQKIQYFIGGEDLEARARFIDQVQPDLVINIHYDASQVDRIQSENNSIEAFVPGGVRKSETGSRILRSQHLKHLLEVRRWNESVSLAGEMIEEMSDQLKLPLLSKPEAFTGIRVRDGVYARNLYLTRRNLSALEVFLECLHYDHVDEFFRMSKNNETAAYRDRAFSYPTRVGEVAKGITDGLLRYFRKLPR